jgi:hypothetical protein
MQQLNYKMVSERKITVCNMILGLKAVAETYLNIISRWLRTVGQWV